MVSNRLILILLSLVAVGVAFPVHAEDMPELEGYQPPPQLFDDPPIATKPFLTFVEPEEPLAQQTKTKNIPTPPRKPAVPAKSAKGAVKRTSDSRSMVFTLPEGVEQKKNAKPFKKPAVKPAVKKVEKPKVAGLKKLGKPSKTQLEEGQRLVNPNVRDVLASIEGVKAPKASKGGKMSLAFLPGETILTLEMKNSLLRDYIPKARDSQDRIIIEAYATPDKNGEDGAKRLSLARATETKDFLTAAGIDEARIDVVPLGNAAESAGVDRVDIMAEEPGSEP